MLIRCDKCTTVYELDEKLLPAHGAPVQCSKCQFVFKAYPEGKAAQPEPRAEAGPVAAEASPGPEPRAAPAGAPVNGKPAEGIAVPPPPSPAGRAPTEPAPEEPKFTADGRPIRKVPFPVEDPAPPTPAAVYPRPAARPGLPKQSGGNPLRWVVPLVLVIALAVALLAWRLMARRPEPPAHRRAEGQSLLLPQGRPEPPARKQSSQAPGPGSAS